MIVRITVSRVIMAGVAVITLWPIHSRAQSIDDMSAYSGYRGYTTYREQFDERRYEEGGETYSADSAKSMSLFEDDAEEKEVVIHREKDGLLSASRESPLETFYRKRTGDKTLTQFGYDMFYNTPMRQDAAVNTSPSGAVQDNYIIQAGDEISVVFSGERQDRGVYSVGSDGRLIIDRMPSIMAMGRRLDDVQKDIQLAFKDAGYYGDVSVTVAAMRQIGVLIAGHVNAPGRHNMNAYHSVLDALNEAGGIKKTGSLRNIKLIRNGSSQYIDL